MRSRKGMLRRERQHQHDEGATAGSGVGMARPNRSLPTASYWLTGWPSELTGSSSWGFCSCCDPQSSPVGQPPGQNTNLVP